MFLHHFSRNLVILTVVAFHIEIFTSPKVITCPLFILSDIIELLGGMGMGMTWINFASIIGLSSIISALITYILERVRKKQEIRFQKVFEEKYRRYNHILAHMLLILDSKNLKDVTMLDLHVKKQYQHILQASGEEALKVFLLKELESYINFYYLFSSKKVINSLYTFLNFPTQDNYIKAACTMKQDLWR